MMKKFLAIAATAAAMTFSASNAIATGSGHGGHEQPDYAAFQIDLTGSAENNGAGLLTGSGGDFNGEMTGMGGNIINLNGSMTGSPCGQPRCANSDGSSDAMAFQGLIGNGTLTSDAAGQEAILAQQALGSVGVNLGVDRPGNRRDNAFSAGTTFDWSQFSNALGSGDQVNIVSEQNGEAHLESNMATANPFCPNCDNTGFNSGAALHNDQSTFMNALGQNAPVGVQMLSNNSGQLNFNLSHGVPQAE